MGTAHVEQLDAVFHHTQGCVVICEVVGVLAADIAGFCEGRDGVGGALGADALIGAAVHELQKLNGEFYVA